MNEDDFFFFLQIIGILTIISASISNDKSTIITIVIIGIFLVLFGMFGEGCSPKNK